jgi:AcrR family transcriptional regulator
MAASTKGSKDRPLAPTVWERPEPVGRPAPAPLSRQVIVAAAITLADRDGLGAVTIRNVAAALYAGPMRLYGYVETKHELLDVMVDTIYGDMVPDRRCGDWREDLATLARRQRDTVRRHRWFLDLLGGRPHVGPNAMAYLEATFAAIRQSPDFDDIDSAMRAARTVNAYVIGALQNEQRELRAQFDSGMDPAHWRDANGPYIFRLLATGRFPNLTDVVRDANHPPPDVAFDDGLQMVLNGLVPRSP